MRPVGRRKRAGLYTFDYPAMKVNLCELLAEYNFEPTLADLESSPEFLKWFEDFQSFEIRKKVLSTTFEEYFHGDWRSGQEVHKVVITQRLYQTSPNSTQA